MKSIVIVDDDPDIRLLCQDRLEHFGYVVHTAESGQEALVLLSIHSFHGMLLDLHLSGLDGGEVLHLIRAQGLTLPVLVISASSSEQPDALVRSGMAQGYLRKPLDCGALDHWLREWVGVP